MAVHVEDSCRVDPGFEVVGGQDREIKWEGVGLESLILSICAQYHLATAMRWREM
jgi:hypothetical protein